MSSGAGDGTTCGRKRTMNSDPLFGHGQWMLGSLGNKTTGKEGGCGKGKQNKGSRQGFQRGVVPTQNGVEQKTGS